VKSVARRVLIVERHEETREAFMLLFEQWGLEAHECGAGPEVILKVARFRPDVAIIDISLPKLDGIAVAKALTAMESSHS
jgi:CheY-like chemotaxis protein